MASMELLSLIHRYDVESSQGKELTNIKTDILKIIEENSMSSVYSTLVSKYNWESNNELVNTMDANNDASLAAINAKIEDAVKNAGDMEVLDGMIAKAKHFFKIGDWKEANAANDAIIAKEKTGTGKKVDAQMEKARIALFNMDIGELKKIIVEAKKLVEIGGDWDRRNRLKVYEALYLITAKDVKGAAKLLLDGVATFTAAELTSYKTYMYYAVLTNIISLDRNDLRKKLVKDPHVISVIRDHPHLQQLLNGIYNCDYRSYFQALLLVHDEAVLDPFLGPVLTYIVRELRVLAYSQFLESYKSVQFSSMATTFNMSPVLLDAELSRFIAAGRINAKIDKVGDIIETKRPDKKNHQYQEVIKKGDLLLNQIQKLVRVIDV